MNTATELSRYLPPLIRSAENLPFAVVIKDPRLRWRYANALARRVFGLPDRGYGGCSDAELLAPDLAARFTSEDAQALAARAPSESNMRISGRRFRIVRQALYAGAKPLGLLMLAIEAPEMDLVQRAIVRQRDFYLALSDVNQAMVREDLTPTAESLYERICRIVVHRTSALLCVVAQLDAARDCLRIIHQSSKAMDAPMLRGLEIPLDPAHPQGQGASARAARERRVVAINDVAAEPGLDAWRSLLDSFGVRSLAAVPVAVEGRLAQVLVVYAGEPDFFGPALIQLLGDLADDMGFALHHRRQEASLRRMALFDPLTGLPNRRHFFELVDAALGKRGQAQGGVLLVTDIDDFKFYNDLFGHETGDQLLCAVADRLSALVHDGAIGGRLGSDEFALWLPLKEAAQENRLPQILQGLREIACDIGWEAPVRVDMALGYARYPADGGDAETLIRRAGMALQAVKQAGRGWARAYEPALEQGLDRRREIMTQVGAALAEQRIEPWFQPQIDVVSGEVVGFEALVRLRSAEGTLMTPDQYIDVIEADARLIRRLGLSMLDSVGRCLGPLTDGGRSLPVSVNVGARHLLAPGFIDDLDAQLERHPALAGCLEIEITEWQKLDDVERVIEVLRTVRGRGLGVVLDDFGSGYSSVASLRELPLTTVKLDQEFVRDLPASVDDQSIVTAMAVAARGLGLRLIAEGVEADEHAELLGALGVRLMQGFAIARPMPLSALPNWLRHWKCPASWRQWARPVSTQGSALTCVGAWFGLRRWLARPEAGEPPAVRQFRRRLAEEADFGCPPPLGAFRSLFMDLSARIEQAQNAGDSVWPAQRERLQAEIEAMGRMMRRAIGRGTLVG